MDSATTLTLAASLYATGTIAWAYKTRGIMEQVRRDALAKFATEAKAKPRRVAIGLHAGMFLCTIGWPILAPVIAVMVAVHLARRSSRRS